MTQDIHPISWERHGTKGWKGYESYQFAEKTALAPLAASEISRAALNLPIAFTKTVDGWQTVAVLSAIPDQNLYVAQNGRWIGGYIPAFLRSYPFRLGRAEGSDEGFLCVDESSGLLVEGGGQPLFDDVAKISVRIGEIWSFIVEVNRGQLQLNGATALLEEVGILIPWIVTANDGEKDIKVEGLYRVDEAALNNLDDEKFSRARKAGVLALVYAQLFSISHIEKLNELGRIRAQNIRENAMEAPTSFEASNSAFAFGESFDIDWSKFTAS